jgi:hypothetical protein
LNFDFYNAIKLRIEIQTLNLTKRLYPQNARGIFMLKVAVFSVIICISSSLFAFESGDYRGKNNEYKCIMRIKQEENSVGIGYQCLDSNRLPVSWTKVVTYKFGNITNNPGGFLNYDLKGTASDELLDLGYYEKENGNLLQRDLIMVSGTGQISFTSSLGKMVLYKD